MYQITKNGAEFEIRAVEKGIFRVRVSSDGEYAESLLSRYNILRESGEAEAKKDGDTVSFEGVSLSVCDDGILMEGAAAPVKITYDGFEGKPYNNRGFTLNLSLTEDERLFGLGDESRKSIARRGSVARLDVRNVASYGPMPFIMSTCGWGMLLNCTYASTFDCGAANRVVCMAFKERFPSTPEIIARILFAVNACERGERLSNVNKISLALVVQKFNLDA